MKAELAHTKKTSDTAEASSLLLLNLELHGLADFTLIFPWGRSSLNSLRTVSYLQYVLSLPSTQRTKAILRLVGMAKYRPLRLLTQAPGRRPRYSRDFLGPSGLVDEHHFRRAGRGHQNKDYQEYQEELWPQ